MNTKDHIVSRPGGMAVAEFKKRHKRTSAEDLSGDQALVGTVGLNTSGALAGIRASSFPNPVLAPPSTLNAAKVFLEKVNKYLTAFSLFKAVKRLFLVVIFNNSHKCSFIPLY